MTKYLQDVTANKYLGIILLLNFELQKQEISYLDCYKLEDSIIVSQDGTFWENLEVAIRPIQFTMNITSMVAHFQTNLFGMISQNMETLIHRSLLFNEYASDAPL